MTVFNSGPEMKTLSAEHVFPRRLTTANYLSIDHLDDTMPLGEHKANATATIDGNYRG